MMSPDVGGIGARLRTGREKLGLTVLQAAEKLHVDARILEYLEAENFEGLGAQVYARGHLRRYADLVGESVAQLDELYSAAATRVDPDLTRIVKAPPPSGSNKLIFPALVILAFFAVAGGVFWILSLTPKKPMPIPEPPGVAGDAAPGGSEPAGATGTATGKDAERPANGIPAAGPPARGKTTAEGAAPGTRLASADATGAVTDAGRGEGVAGAAANAPPSAESAAPMSREKQVTLRFTADSWAEVYDASGERLFNDVGAANSVRTFKGAAPLRVVLGNAPGVTLEIDGHEASLARVSQPDGQAQFLITRSGHVAHVRPAATGN